jgi:hypothetical protein
MKIDGREFDKEFNLIEHIIISILTDDRTTYVEFI